MRETHVSSPVTIWSEKLSHQKRQNSTHMLALAQIFFVVEMLRNNFMDQRARNLKKFLMNFIKSEMPVCPNVLINPVFQVLSVKRQAPGITHHEHLSCLC